VHDLESLLRNPLEFALVGSSLHNRAQQLDGITSRIPSFPRSARRASIHLSRTAI
jgi:hypothetical protein